jgi:hypothetical protein
MWVVTLKLEEQLSFEGVIESGVYHDLILHLHIYPFNYLSLD